MVINPTYKSYATQIAEIYCEDQINPTLCTASVKQRIVNAFTDETFESSFLPYLDKNRFFSLEVVRVQKENRFNEKIVFRGFDIVTGKSTGDFHINAFPGSYQFAEQTDDPQKYDFILQRKNYRFVDLMNGRIIVRKPLVNYGIVFVPSDIDPGIRIVQEFTDCIISDSTGFDRRLDSLVREW